MDSTPAEDTNTVAAFSSSPESSMLPTKKKDIPDQDALSFPQESEGSPKLDLKMQPLDNDSSSSTSSCYSSYSSSSYSSSSGSCSLCSRSFSSSDTPHRRDRKPRKALFSLLSSSESYDLDSKTALAAIQQQVEQQEAELHRLSKILTEEKKFLATKLQTDSKLTPMIPSGPDPFPLLSSPDSIQFASENTVGIEAADRSTSTFHLSLSLLPITTTKPPTDNLLPPPLVANGSDISPGSMTSQWSSMAIEEHQPSGAPLPLHDALPTSVSVTALPPTTVLAESNVPQEPVRSFPPDDPSSTMALLVSDSPAAVVAPTTTCPSHGDPPRILLSPEPYSEPAVVPAVRPPIAVMQPWALPTSQVTVGVAAPHAATSAWKTAEPAPGTFNQFCQIYSSDVAESKPIQPNEGVDPSPFGTSPPLESNPFAELPASIVEPINITQSQPLSFRAFSETQPVLLTEAVNEEHSLVEGKDKEPSEKTNTEPPKSPLNTLESNLPLEAPVEELSLVHKIPTMAEPFEANERRPLTPDILFPAPPRASSELSPERREQINDLLDEKTVFGSIARSLSIFGDWIAGICK